MPDAMVQLAKEFLEVHGYIVSTSVKMRLKGRKAKRTESDVDIIGYRYKPPIDYWELPYDRTLEKYIIAEVKSTHNGVDKSYFKEIKSSKFDSWNKEYLKRYAPLSQMQKILFCSHATEETINKAKKEGIKIVTAIHMLKVLSQIINNKGEKSNAYYPERPIYSTLRVLIDLLNKPTKENEESLLLEDLLWIIDFHKRDRNNFMEKNRDALISLLKNESNHETRDKLMEQIRDEDWWQFYYVIIAYFEGLPNKHREQLINGLIKKNKKLLQR